MNIFGIYDKYHNSVNLLQNYVQNYVYAVMASIKKPAKKTQAKLAKRSAQKNSKVYLSLERNDSYYYFDEGSPVKHSYKCFNERSIKKLQEFLDKNYRGIVVDKGVGLLLSKSQIEVIFMLKDSFIKKEDFEDVKKSVQKFCGDLIEAFPNLEIVDDLDLKIKKYSTNFRESGVDCFGMVKIHFPEK